MEREMRTDEIDCFGTWASSPKRSPISAAREIARSISVPFPTQLVTEANEPGESDHWIDLLLAGSTGIHVDFHADLDFHNLRSFPTHFQSPQCYAR
jgi:hypothetical protein